MDAGLENIIRRALEDARAKGQDYITQTGLAVKAAREARSDMTASDAPVAVKMA